MGLCGRLHRAIWCLTTHCLLVGSLLPLVLLWPPSRQPDDPLARSQIMSSPLENTQCSCHTESGSQVHPSAWFCSLCWHLLRQLPYLGAGFSLCPGDPHLARMAIYSYCSHVTLTELFPGLIVKQAVYLLCFNSCPMRLSFVCALPVSK